MSLADAYDWFAGLALRYKLLAFATTVVLIEIAFRRLAPHSRASERWTRFFQGLGVLGATE